MDPLTDQPRIRVVIADDETLMRAGLRLMIDGTRDIEVVGEAPDGAQAVDLVRELEPDVVLMDVRMPGMDGLAATAELVASGVPARIVVLTSFDTDDYLLRALQAGACSFLLKDTPPEDVIDAVVRAARDEPRFSAGALRSLVGLAAGGTPGPTADPGDRGDSTGTRTRESEPTEALSERPTPTASPHTAAPDVGVGSEPTTLPVGITTREWDVARLVAEGMTNAEIAQRLHLSLPTIKTHLGRLFDKLQVTNRVQLALRVIELDG